MSFQAVMTLHMCLETYGAAVHVMDALMGVSAEQAGHSLRRSRLVREAGRTSEIAVGPAQSAARAAVSNPCCHDAAAPTADDLAFAVQVRRGAQALPFSLAQALWLVDVCQCSYDEAAAQAGVSRNEIAARIATGRRHVRASLGGEPAVAPVG